MINKNILLVAFLVGVFFTVSAMGMKKRGLMEEDIIKYVYKVSREGDKVLALAFSTGEIKQPNLLVTKNTKNNEFTRECIFFENGNGAITGIQLDYELDRLVAKIQEFEEAELKNDKKEKKQEKAKESKFGLEKDKQ